MSEQPVKDEKAKQREEALKRIAEARERILEQRRKQVKDAPKITQQLLEGVNYTEEIPVMLKDGSYGMLEISALSEGELMEAFKVLGAEKLSRIDEENVFDIDDYDFFWTLIALSTGLDKELIKKSFRSGESVTVGQRILQISGVGGEEIESFPEE